MAVPGNGRAGRSTIENRHRLIHRGDPRSIAGVVAPRLSVQRVSEGDPRDFASGDDPLRVAAVVVERRADDDRSVAAAEPVRAEHQRRVRRARALDRTQHPSTRRPGCDAGPNHGEVRLAGDAVDLAVEDQQPVTCRVRDNLARPERNLGVAGLDRAVIACVRGVERQLVGGQRQELARHLRRVQVIAPPADPVCGVEIPRPRHRVVGPVVTVRAGRAHRRVPEGPDGHAVEERAPRVVTPEDHRVLLHRSDVGDRADRRYAGSRNRWSGAVRRNTNRGGDERGEHERRPAAGHERCIAVSKRRTASGGPSTETTTRRRAACRAGRARRPSHAPAPHRLPGARRVRRPDAQGRRVRRRADAARGRRRVGAGATAPRRVPGPAGAGPDRSGAGRPRGGRSTRPRSLPRAPPASPSAAAARPGPARPDRRTASSPCACVQPARSTRAAQGRRGRVRCPAAVRG